MAGGMPRGTNTLTALGSLLQDRGQAGAAGKLRPHLAAALRAEITAASSRKAASNAPRRVLPGAVPF